MDNKRMYFCLGNKWGFLFICVFVFVGTTPCWIVPVLVDIPIFAKILLFIIGIATAIECIIVFSNGFLITPKENIFFVSGLLIKKINMEELFKIELIFNERGYNKYSAKIRFIYKSGKILVKDYFDPFKSVQTKNSVTFIYLIKKQKVEVICERLSRLNIFYITIMDRNLQTVYQNRY